MIFVIKQKSCSLCTLVELSERDSLMRFDENTVKRTADNFLEKK
jgi:hypothetical protein